MIPRPGGFAIEAEELFRLEPLGRHGMLIAPALGERTGVEMQLHFENAGEVSFTAAVEGGQTGMDHSQMEHSADNEDPAG